MIKEIKYFVFTIFILLFIFFTGKYYFSDDNLKLSYRSNKNISEKIMTYSQKLDILENDTNNIIEYKKQNNKKKKKKKKI